MLGNTSSALGGGWEALFQCQMKQGWKETGSSGYQGIKRPLEPLTFCLCLKSSSCSTEKQSIQVLIRYQRSVIAAAESEHVCKVLGSVGNAPPQPAYFQIFLTTAAI